MEKRQRTEAAMRRQDPGKQRRLRGFGLIELLVALFLAALLLGLAIPAYNDWIATTEMMNEAQHLASSMNQARAAAINSGFRVNLCQTGGTSDAASAGAISRPPPRFRVRACCRGGRSPAASRCR